MGNDDNRGEAGPIASGAAPRGHATALDRDIGQLRALARALKARLVERDAVIDGALGALVAGQHVLLIGPPGTAKSLLARLVCQSLVAQEPPAGSETGAREATGAPGDGGEPARYFQWLLTRFSTPEELFGPIDLRALEAGRYERRTEGSLATAHVAFLDEIFKANSAILNALLTLLNERVYYNDGRPHPAPLLTLFAASNEVPDEDALAALHDRFLLRFWVAPIADDTRFTHYLRHAEDAHPALPRLTLGALERLRAAALALPVTDAALTVLTRLRRELDHRGLFVSDRRYRELLRYLRAVALLAGEEAVTPDTLPHAEAALWSDPEDRAEVAAALVEALTGYTEEARRLLYQAREVHAFAQRAATAGAAGGAGGARDAFHDVEAEARAAIEAHAKLGRLLSDADRLLRLQSERVGPDAATAGELAEVRDEIARLQRDVLEGDGWDDDGGQDNGPRGGGGR